MIPELPLPPEGEVWVCHKHQMIGPKDVAETHAHNHGCDIERVPDDVAEQVRAERLRRHDEFVAGLIMAGRSGMFAPAAAALGETQPQQGGSDT